MKNVCDEVMAKLLERNDLNAGVQMAIFENHS